MKFAHLVDVNDFVNLGVITSVHWPLPSVVSVLQRVRG